MTLVFLLGQSSVAQHLPEEGSWAGARSFSLQQFTPEEDGSAGLPIPPHKKWAFSPQTRAVGKIRLSNTYILFSSHLQLRYWHRHTTHLPLYSFLGTIQPHYSLPRDTAVFYREAKVMSRDQTSTSVMLSTYRSPTTSIPSWR